MLRWVRYYDISVGCQLSLVEKEEMLVSINDALLSDGINQFETIAHLSKLLLVTMLDLDRKLRRAPLLYISKRE